MASRRYASDVTVDRYDERRDNGPRGGSGGGGSRGYEERYVDEEVIDYRSRGPPRERERERDVIIREDVRESARSPPAYLREDYGRTNAGPVVLRARETEEYEFAPPPVRRRRSPSPEPERTVEREEIVIRRDESDSRGPPGSRDRDREEIIIRRDERDRDRRGPPPREAEREREEIIIRRDEGGGGRRPAYADDYEREPVVSRRGDLDRGGPGRGDYDREEIIIRRDERDSDDREARFASRRYDDYAPTRPISHERERSRARRPGSDSEQEIIIRRDEREGRGGKREREEIIIRKTSHSRSPSPSSASTRLPAPEPPIIQAPPIHQEVITHHRHIDHGYELALATRPISRPPSPPMPPPPRERSEERIEIHRSGERNGRPYDEDIIIDRNDGRRPAQPPPQSVRDLSYDALVRPGRPYDRDRDREEEAEYYNDRAMDRSYVGEGYHGSTRDWAIVDVPPGTRRVRMDGVGGGGQEITWQRYNGVRRSKFYPDGYSDEGYGSEVGRPANMPAPGGDIGRRYGRERDPREGLWTEITKDLVVKEAITELGYEYEETDDFYYIISYLRYEDVARIVGLSEDIRKDRRKRMKEIEWESRVLPEPAIEESKPRLMIEGGPRSSTSRHHHHDSADWNREDERYIEREIVYRGGRPPPPPGWR